MIYKTRHYLSIIKNKKIEGDLYQRLIIKIQIFRLNFFSFQKTTGGYIKD